MSDVIFEKVLRKARKEHTQTIDVCFDELLIRNSNKIRIVNEFEAKSIGMTWNEIQIIKEALKNNWKIFPGEKYYTWSGVNSDWFWTTKVSVKLYDIITKYELWPEY